MRPSSKVGPVPPGLYTVVISHPYEPTESMNMFYQFAATWVDKNAEYNNKQKQV